jgi:agmatine/peptidylarginine deiminase
LTKKQNDSISDIEIILQVNDEEEFQEHLEKLSKAYLELVERTISNLSPIILYVNQEALENKTREKP